MPVKSTRQERTKVLKLIGIIFILCSIVEYIEFLFIRTDQTIIADNILTKLFCIAVIMAGLKISNLKLRDIGFRKKKIFKFAAAGFALGIITFVISYSVEILVLMTQDKFVKMSFYITNFGLNGATSEVSLSTIAVLICIAVNIINVIAEEGLFRGLILRLGTDKFGFKTANWMQAALLGAGIS